MQVSMPAATLMSRCEKSELIRYEELDLFKDEEFKLNVQKANMDMSGVRVTVELMITCPDGIVTRHIVSSGKPVLRHRYGSNWSIDASTDYTCYDNEELRHSTNDLGYASLTTLTEAYTWTHWNHTSEDPIARHFWHCHYSWARVMVTVDMVSIDGEVTIDHSRPPRPDNSTLRPWNPPLPIPSLERHEPIAPSRPHLGDAYPFLHSYDMPREIHVGNMNNEFKLLIQPYGDIPIEDFGNPGKDEKIVRALAHNRAVLSAQLLNMENRLSLEEAPNAEPLPPVEAFLIDHDRKRIVQSPTATYLLLGILGFVAGTNIIMLLSTVLRRYIGPRKWLLDMDVKGLAPNGFNSIGMMAALLRPSNAMQYMPSQVLSQAETYEQLRVLRFRMGWFRRESDQTRHFTIGVLGDENFTFLGGKNDLDSEGLERTDQSV